MRASREAPEPAPFWFPSQSGSGRLRGGLLHIILLWRES